MDPEVVRVLADDRERGCLAAATLGSMPGVHLVEKRLLLGDYRVDDRLLVERKTWSDLVASIEDGRLFRQAHALAKGPLHPLLILEGRIRGTTLGGIRREALQGALMTVSLVWGVPILRALDGMETAQLILLAARQSRRAAQGLPRRPGLCASGKRFVQHWILQGLPRIGPRRAALLLAQFGSVEAVLTASEAALRAVPGLGPRTAEGIRWAVG